jgi:hypothetical protein
VSKANRSSFWRRNSAHRESRSRDTELLYPVALLPLAPFHAPRSRVWRTTTCNTASHRRSQSGQPLDFVVATVPVPLPNSRRGPNHEDRGLRDRRRVRTQSCRPAHSQLIRTGSHSFSAFGREISLKHLDAQNPRSGEAAHKLGNTCDKGLTHHVAWKLSGPRSDAQHEDSSQSANTQRIRRHSALTE